MQHFDFKRAETLRRPNRNAEARALQGGRESVEDGQRQPGARASAVRDGAVFDTRTQRRKINCERCAALRSPDLDIALEPTDSCAYGWRQPNDAPLDIHAFRPGRRRQQPLGETGPGFRQTVAHEQHDVGAHARFAGRREHDSSLAQTVEIPQQSRRMPMLDDAADPSSERNGRSCPVDIGAEPGDERLTASGQKQSRARSCGVQRNRCAVDRCCGLRADWIFQRHTLRRLVSYQPRIDAGDLQAASEVET